MNEKPIRWEEDILIIMANDTSVSNVFLLFTRLLDRDSVYFHSLLEWPADYRFAIKQLNNR